MSFLAFNLSDLPDFFFSFLSLYMFIAYKSHSTQRINTRISHTKHIKQRALQVFQFFTFPTLRISCECLDNNLPSTLLVCSFSSSTTPYLGTTGKYCKKKEKKIIRQNLTKREGRRKYLVVFALLLRRFFSRQLFIEFTTTSCRSSS